MNRARFTTITENVWNSFNIELRRRILKHIDKEFVINTASIESLIYFFQHEVKNVSAAVVVYELQRFKESMTHE